jgi:hypothetical protein
MIYELAWNQNGTGFYLVSIAIHDGVNDITKEELLKVVKSIKLK